MFSQKNKSARALCAIVAASVGVASLTGCAAGNFGLTRKLAGWNLSFSTVPRVIIYVAFVIIPVYELALLFDFVINNTVEFWTNSAVITSQNQTFTKDGYKVVVNNTRDPLRKSVYTAYDKEGRVTSISELREMKDGSIAVYLNGELKARVQSIRAGLAEIAVTNPSDPQIMMVKAPTETKKLDLTKLHAIRKLLMKEPVIAQAVH